MPVTRIVHYRARPGVEEALHNALLKTVPVIANAKGCLKVRMLSSLDDGAEFVMYEEWETIEAHRTAAAGFSARFASKAASLLAAPPRSSYYAG